MTSHPVLRQVEKAFAAMARARNARAFHPRGGLAAATLTVDDPESVLARTLGTGEYAGRVRLSHGIGLPEPWPDLRGLALRLQVPDTFDVLFTTVGRLGPMSRMVLPARSWISRRYGTVMPYVWPGGRVTFELVPERAEPLTLRLVEHRRWRRHTVGRLTVGEVGEDGPITYDPVLHHHPELRLIRPFSRLRATAYAGSRRGRGAPLGTGSAEDQEGSATRPDLTR